MSRTINQCMDAVRQAMSKPDDDPQKIICTEILLMADLLLRKNADYGCSAWGSPILAPNIRPKDAILVRLSDKVARLNSLMKNGTAQVAESIEDTVRDMSCYGVLWLTCPDSE